MTETKNPAIKLFGKRIKVPPLPEGVFPPLPTVDSAEKEVDEEDYEETEQDHSKEQASSNKQGEDEPSLKAEELTSPQVSTPSINEEASESKASKTGKDPKDPPKSQALKKPDKILPCPRCNSMETKFCYYNNYNINQPRHFCKSCQRYWTAGGTMRNVPVGAGRRKSKSSASRYQHISISEALQAVARVDSPNSYPNLTPDGTVLNFGLGQHGPVASTVEKRAISDRSSGNFPNERPISNHARVVPQTPCLNSVPWPYSVPVPFYPPAFWACSNVGIPGAWNFPLVSAPSLIPGQNSPILGKHPREGDVIKTEKNGSILIPKTLRMDDPTEAAKSSIWATLGIKNECGAKGGLFRGFQPKGKENEKAGTKTEQYRVLCANPAALSRSLNFHEST